MWYTLGAMVLSFGLFMAVLIGGIVMLGITLVLGILGLDWARAYKNFFKQRYEARQSHNLFLDNRRVKALLKEEEVEFQVVYGKTKRNALFEYNGRNYHYVWKQEVADWFALNEIPVGTIIRNPGTKQATVSFKTQDDAFAFKMRWF